MEYQTQLKQTETELEELKHKHFVTTQDQLSTLMEEKSEIKEAFDNAIKKLKNAHDQDVMERKDQIAMQKNMTYDLLEEIRELRTKAESQVESLSAEINNLRKAVDSGRKLNEMQVEDNARLRDELMRFKNENMLLSRETSMLENDSSKLRNQNDSLRKSIINLDKIV